MMYTVSDVGIEWMVRKGLIVPLRTASDDKLVNDLGTRPSSGTEANVLYVH